MEVQVVALKLFWSTSYHLSKSVPVFLCLRDDIWTPNGNSLSFFIYIVHGKWLHLHVHLLFFYNMEAFLWLPVFSLDYRALPKSGLLLKKIFAPWGAKCFPKVDPNRK